MEQLDGAYPVESPALREQGHIIGAIAQRRLNAPPGTVAPATLDAAQVDPEQALANAQTRIERLEREIAQLRRAVADERRHAYVDALTGLPNRRLLMDRFDQALARGVRQHTKIALLFLDLDGFKCINDALGHASGDQLLLQVARRLKACIRAADTVCRFGGDEFVVLLAQIESQERAQLVVRKIRTAVAKPYLLQEQVVRVTTSIGMAVYPTDGKSYAELLERSDIAMYFDKARACIAPAWSHPPAGGTD